MALKKITETEMDQQGVCAAPDILDGSPAENKSIFDRMVRKLIAPAYNECVDAVNKINEEEAQWAAAEEGRVEAESGRVAAEEQRVRNELERQTNEQARSGSESERKTAEEARKTAETQRAAAEEQRVSAEKSRLASETVRVDAEKNRVTTEQNREAAEKTRVTAEQDRTATEQIRVDSEQRRTEEEQARNVAESERVAAEEIRQQNANAMKIWEEYSGTKAYVPLNKVTWNGSSYVCIKPCTGVTPKNEEYWLMIVRKGADGGGTTDINIRKWYEKKIIVDGSSITAGGSGNTIPTWHSFLKDMFALDAVYNHSLSGSGWFIGGTTTTMDRVSEYEDDADAVILMGDYNGIYNYTRGVGTIDDEPSLDGLCYARLKYLAETLINKYPLCPIIWVIEPPRASVGQTDGLVPMNHNSNQAKYAAIIEEVADLYGFTHCNLMKNTVFRPWIQENYDATTSDGTHPWNNIQRTMAQVIAETMKRTPIIYNESYVNSPDNSSGGTTEDDGNKTVTALSVILKDEIFESDTLETVRKYLTVKATYSDLSVATVTDYDLSGTLTAGTSTLTVTYGGITTTKDVSVTAGQRTVSIELLEQNVTEGYYLNGTGTPTTLSGYGYTDFISVKGGTDVKFSGTGGVHGLNCGFVEYDEDQNFIKIVDTANGTYTYSLGETTAYIRCNVKVGYSNTLTYVPG